MPRVSYRFERSNILSRKAHTLIPGGAHTYSKGDDQFPSNAPKIIDYGKGCEIFDVDGNRWLDLGMSLGAMTLGHAYEPVISAAKKELDRGCNFVRPSILEGELAELLNSIIPSAEMVKFGKNGSDAVTAAVKLARAYTGRDYILRCADDPFNSIHDWFIGSTVMKRGVPKVISDLTLKFRYNDIESVKKMFDKHPNKIACVLLEPISSAEPTNNFLHELKSLCEKNGTLLIFDEVVSGFRFDIGGAQVVAGVTPHLSAFGKAMANGFSVSALVGAKEFMRLGGLDHNEERVFLLSTTHGGETHALAASIATIQEIKKQNAIEHFYSFGNKFISLVNEKARTHSIQSHVEAIGYGCKPGVIFKNEKGEPSAELRTLYMQELCNFGILAPYIVPCLAHNESTLLEFEAAIEEVFPIIKNAITNGTSNFLHGNVVKPVFRKFN